MLEIFSLELSTTDSVGIIIGLIGLAIGIVGLAIALIFNSGVKKQRIQDEKRRIETEKRRIEDEKDYLKKREKCGQLLIAAHSNPKTPQAYRTILWLRLETGMSDSEFYQFYNEFRELCKKSLNDDKEIIVKIDKDCLDQFKIDLAKEPSNQS